MQKKISFQEKIYVAGANGMVGSAVCKKLKEKGYGDERVGGSLLRPKRSEQLVKFDEVKYWFSINKPLL